MGVGLRVGAVGVVTNLSIDTEIQYSETASNCTALYLHGMFWSRSTQVDPWVTVV